VCRIITVTELEGTTSKEEYATWRRHCGGDYAYTLGYIWSGRYRPTRNRRRPDFAVMADAPDLRIPGFLSSNHDGRGLNTLFEDGHVGFLVEPVIPSRGDGIYVNDDNQISAGTHVNDSVTGASDASPVSPRDPRRVIWRVEVRKTGPEPSRRHDR
jgi:prepilin-type processing-associated H-X9-DG protein